MTRTADSAADHELTARLAARGLTGSGARYERWRRAGLLPRHERHWAGRGRGSASVLDPATVEIAAALARHARQGRDLRDAVIAWFFEAGRPVPPGQPAVPEPPDAKVTEALAWSLRSGPDHRMLQRARSAVTEEQRDDVYAALAGQRRQIARAAGGPDPSAVREALLSGRDVDPAPSGEPADLVHLVAAMGLGIEEVGAEAFADAVTATGMFPQLSAQEWRDVMIEAFASGAYAREFAALARLDPASAAESAGTGRLREARGVALGLAGFGAMLLMHGLLMPETPALAALRARIKELGAGPVLMNLARQAIQPQGAAAAIASCLDPMYTAMYHSLVELAASGPPLLHQAGDDEHNSERFMETWLANIRALSSTTGPAKSLDPPTDEKHQARQPLRAP